MARRYWTWTVGFSIAFITLLIASGGAEWGHAASEVAVGSQRSVVTDESRVLATRVGEYRSILLRGGPEVTLNTATVVRSDLSEDLERFSLEAGEVLIDATIAGTKLIQVSVGDAAAVETSYGKFSVRRDKRDAYSVRVYRGEVTILRTARADARPSSAFQPVRLQAGKAAMIGPGAVVLSRFSEANEVRYLAWTRGQIVFDGDTLARAVEEINRYNLLKIEIADPSVAKIRVGGLFIATNPEGFAKKLEAVFEVRSEVKASQEGGAGVILVSRKNRRP